MTTDWLKCNESSQTLKHGAVFVEQAEVDPNFFTAVDVTVTSGENDTKEYTISVGTVDVTAEWIKWKEFNEIFPNNVLPPYGSPTVETVARLYYFHRNEFQGMVTKTSSQEKVIEELTSYGISLEVIH